MADRWEAGEEVKEMADMVIREYHHDLLDVKDEIAYVFREKASKSGGVPILGKTSKAPQILSVLSDKSYKFIIELAADFWHNELTSPQRVALLDHHLCACHVEFDEETGEYKTSVIPPDVVGYKEEIERHGYWRPESEPLLEENTEE